MGQNDTARLPVLHSRHEHDGDIQIHTLLAKADVVRLGHVPSKGPTLVSSRHNPVVELAFSLEAKLVGGENDRMAQ